MEVELNTRNLGIERWLRNSLQRAVCALSSSGALILWRKPRVCAVSAFTLGGLLQCLPGRVEPGRRPLTASSQNDYIGGAPPGTGDPTPIALPDCTTEPEDGREKPAWDW
jgi:hypothetical protein